jgi:D-arabinose 1-dehydrogenase-like Zn-dependent alcohol dehydrogenase
MLGTHYNGHPEAQQLIPRIGKCMMDLLLNKQIKALVNTTISLKDVPQALQKMKEGASSFKGKTVVKF